MWYHTIIDRAPGLFFHQHKAMRNALPLTCEIQCYSTLTLATLNKSPHFVVKRVLEGQYNADTVQCFYWPAEKPCSVSRGLELRLGSLLSAFISVSFTISFFLSLPQNTSLQRSPSLCSAALFSPRSRRRKCHQRKLVRPSNTACLPAFIPQREDNLKSKLSTQTFCQKCSRDP